MNAIQKETIRQMNEYGAKGKPFVFIIDFDFEKPLILEADDTSRLHWKTPEKSNYKLVEASQEDLLWSIHPVGMDVYEKAFLTVQQHIHQGDTYLLNLTMPTAVESNLSLEQIFQVSNAPYKLWLKDQFVCFSPEIFVRIKDGIISSFPMKGTI
ncbi:MAG: chorismate-binding protein, partial [Verrucomicrobia bacterium]|nr:chorismate-binding protein [Prolixibacteraceae bacterium]